MSSESESEEFYDAVDITPKHIDDGDLAEDSPLKDLSVSSPTAKIQRGIQVPAQQQQYQQQQQPTADLVHGVEAGHHEVSHAPSPVFKVPHAPPTGGGPITYRHNRTKRAEESAGGLMVGGVSCRASGGEDHIGIAEDSCSSLSGSLLGNLRDDDELASSIPTTRVSTARLRRRHAATVTTASPHTSPPHHQHGSAGESSCGHDDPCNTCVMQPFRVVEPDAHSVYSSVSNKLNKGGLCSAADETSFTESELGGGLDTLDTSVSSAQQQQILNQDLPQQQLMQEQRNKQIQLEQQLEQQPPPQASARLRHQLHQSGQQQAAATIAPTSAAPPPPACPPSPPFTRATSTPVKGSPTTASFAGVGLSGGDVPHGGLAEGETHQDHLEFGDLVAAQNSAINEGLVLSAEPDLVASTKASNNNPALIGRLANSGDSSTTEGCYPQRSVQDTTAAAAAASPGTAAFRDAESNSYISAGQSAGGRGGYPVQTHQFCPATRSLQQRRSESSQFPMTGITATPFPKVPSNRPSYTAIPFSSQSLPASSQPPKPPLPPLSLARKHKSHPALLHISVVDPTRGIDHVGNIAEALNQQNPSIGSTTATATAANIDSQLQPNFDESQRPLHKQQPQPSGAVPDPTTMPSLSNQLSSEDLCTNPTLLDAIQSNEVGLVMSENLLSRLQYDTSMSSDVNKGPHSATGCTAEAPAVALPADGAVMPPPVAPPRKRRKRKQLSEDDNVSMTSSCSQRSRCDSFASSSDQRLHGTSAPSSQPSSPTLVTTTNRSSQQTAASPVATTAPTSQQTAACRPTAAAAAAGSLETLHASCTTSSMTSSSNTCPQPLLSTSTSVPCLLPTASLPPRAPPSSNVPLITTTTPTPPATPLISRKDNDSLSLRLSSLGSRSTKLLRHKRLVGIAGLLPGGKRAAAAGGEGGRGGGLGTWKHSLKLRAPPSEAADGCDPDGVSGGGGDTISIGKRSLDIKAAIMGKFLVKDFGRSSSPQEPLDSPPACVPTLTVTADTAATAPAPAAAQAAAAEALPAKADELDDQEILSQVSLLNLDTGVRLSMVEAPAVSPNPLNPLSLQIMKLTNGPCSGEDGDTDDNSSIASSSRDSDNDNNQQITHAVKKRTVKMKKLLERRVGSAVLRAAKSITHRTGDDKDVFADDAPTQSTGTYVKIKTAHGHKGPHEWDDLMYVQEITGKHQGPVWCAKFSLCGRLLATAGQDQLLRVWVIKQAFHFFLDIRTKYNPDIKVSPTPSEESLSSTPGGDSSGTDDAAHLDPEDYGHAPFMPRPFCVYEGHSADLLDVAWSKNYFLLTSSMDKTVRLWHISRKECLCIFQHVDFVTAIAFHPKDDRYFISGSLDGKLRLWSIPEKRVVLWTEVVGAFITAANFCQNGAYTVVGTYDGRCLFYTTNQLKYNTQFNVRSARGKNSKGRKITGIESLPGENKVLVTSNDSRIRLYGLDEHSEHCKYRGLTNLSSQISASFSHDGKYIVAGSENQCIYIWKTHHDHGKFNATARRDRNAYWEGVKAHSAVVTCALFSPHPELVFNFIEQQEQLQQQQQQGSASAAGAASTGSGGSSSASQSTTGGDKQHKHDSLGNNKGYMLVSADFNGCIKVFLKKEKPKHSSLPASALA